MKVVYVVLRTGVDIPVTVCQTKQEAIKRLNEFEREGLGEYKIGLKVINDELYSDIFRPTIKFN